MSTKQTIAVIGAGNMGSAIARSLSKKDNRLLLFTHRREKALALASDIRNRRTTADVEVCRCPEDASLEADVIILAVPYAAEKEVAETIRQGAHQKVVISISNPLNKALNGLTTGAGTSAAEELQLLLPQSKIVKAFNTVFASDFATPVIDGRQADAFIAGNDARSVRTAAHLASAAGFNPVVAGDLSMSRTLEYMTLMLIQLTMKYHCNWPAGHTILQN